MAEYARAIACTNEAAELLARGWQERDVLKHLMSVREFGSDRARRLIRKAWLEFSKRLRKGREAQILRQNEKLEWAQRTAASLEKVWVHWDKNGVKDVHREHEPDVSAFTRAVIAQNKLLGLDAPDKRAVVLASLGAIASDIVAVALRMIPEEQRDEFLERVDDEMREKMKLEAGGEEIIEVEALPSGGSDEGAS